MFDPIISGLLNVLEPGNFIALIGQIGQEKFTNAFQELFASETDIPVLARNFPSGFPS